MMLGCLLLAKHIWLLVSVGLLWKNAMASIGSVGDCDFEGGWCGYTQSTSDLHFNWVRTSWDTDSSGSGPSNDHTLGTSEGHYLGMDASGSVEWFRATLLSPKIPQMESGCLQFYYQMKQGMSPADKGILEVKISEYQLFQNLKPSPVFTKIGPQAPGWLRARLPVRTQSMFSVEIEAVSGGPFQGYMAIDDLWLTDESCDKLGVLSHCDFDEGLCNYTQSTDDDFDWTRRYGSTITWLTGPTMDHTLKNITGSYMYIESSGHRRTDDTAVLYTDLLPPLKDGCLEFYYHMLGESIGSLHVMVTDQAYNPEKTIFSLRGKQGPDWLRALVPLSSDRAFSVGFSGVRGASIQGDIAIDDVTITDSPCKQTGLTTRPTTIGPTTTPTMTSTSAPLTTSAVPGLDSWACALSSACSGSVRGPMVWYSRLSDNALDRNFFRAIPSDNANQTTSFITPLLSPVAKTVLFRYRMEADKIDQFTVSTVGNSGNQIVQHFQTWESSSDWKYVTFWLPEQPSPFQIHFDIEYTDDGNPSVPISQRDFSYVDISYIAVNQQQNNTDATTSYPPVLSTLPSTSDICDNKPCVNGGTCSIDKQDFACSCPKGYTGKRCESVVNFCSSRKCMNGGTCRALVEGYFCQCPFGHRGVHCEIVESTCASNPCQNGARCLSLVSGYLCQCAAGYDGINCEIDVDECSNSPCLNGGSCTDLVSGFSCACPAGYKGRTCGAVVNECDANPCHSHGLCLSLLKGHLCLCNAGYKGLDCETDTRPCGSAPCKNGANCANTDTGFTCSCPAGYTGVDCATDIDDCSSSHCLNGGNCTDLINDFSCQCLSGFQGRNCEINVDECVGSLCENGGTCVDGINQYTCDCPMFFNGTLCEHKLEECDIKPCQNGGTCFKVSAGHFCHCAVGYTGTNCEHDEDDCSWSPCSNGGTCTDILHGFTCTCPRDYTGKTCGTALDICTTLPCQNGGSCLALLHGYLCQCTKGYHGLNCDENIDDCFPGACYGGATCVDGLNEYNCTCPPGFRGERCDYNIDDCASNPCRNGGSCTDGDDSFTCACPPGYTGLTCVTNINECASAPCQNGAVCSDGVDQYTCRCSVGYTGSQCEYNIDDCAIDPCQHGGICLDLVNGFKCTCSSGYTGVRCENDINECRSSPCQHGATCLDKTNGFTCKCPKLFNGTMCETEIHECDLAPCQNGGRCLALLNGYICQCPAHYCGKVCETVKYQVKDSQTVLDTDSSLGCGITPSFKDCQDARNRGVYLPGVYEIDPDGEGSFSAWCDFVGGEGWLVFQRRMDGSVDFYRDWQSYADGFGHVSGEYWLGNTNLHRLTGSKNVRLNIVLTDFQGLTKVANYSSFQVSGAFSKYKLGISGFSGDAGDPLTQGAKVIDGAFFSTLDSDNDQSTAGFDCAKMYKGGWWYNSCQSANPNGIYAKHGTSAVIHEGITWAPWHHEYESLKETIFRISD